MIYWSIFYHALLLVFIQDSMYCFHNMNIQSTFFCHLICNYKKVSNLCKFSQYIPINKISKTHCTHGMHFKMQTVN